MTNQPQETSPDRGEIHAQRGDQPNTSGFAGGASTPEPAPAGGSTGQVDGESVAVPAGDLTGALTEALEEVGQGRDPDEDRG